MRKRINITLNEEIYTKIKEIATKDHRSVSNKIECILETYTERPDMFSTPVNYPNTTHSPIPETQYKVTANAPTKRNIIEEEDDEDYDKDF